MKEYIIIKPNHASGMFSFIWETLKIIKLNLNNCFGFHGRGDPRNTCDHDGFYQQFQDKLKLLESV